MSNKATKKKKPEPQDERAAEASSTPDDGDGGLSALSALVRASTLPPPSLGTEGSDGDDGKLDLRALAASIPPPAPLGVEAPASVDEPDGEPSSARASRGAAASGVVKAPAAPRAASVSPAHEPVASEVAPAARGGGGLWIGIGIGAVVAAGAVFFVMSGQGGEPSAPMVSAATEPSALQLRSAAEPGAGSTAPATAPASVGGPSPVEPSPAEPAVVEPAAAEPAAAEPAVAEPSADEPHAAQPLGLAPSTPEAAPAVAARAAEPTRPAAAARASSEEPAARRERPAREASPVAAAAPAAEPATPAPGRGRAASAEPAARPQRSESIDNLLDQALGGRPARDGTTPAASRPAPTPAPASAAARAPAPAPAPAPAANLPETPNQSEVVRTLGRLMPQIRQCAGEQTGTAPTAIVLRSDGTVASASVGGAFAGSPQGRCIEGVISNARFSPFRQTTFRVSHALSIR